MTDSSERTIRLGEVCGIYGVKGWVKLLSFTEPRANLLDYGDWLLSGRDGPIPVRVEAAEARGKHLIAKFVGIDDRDEARQLIGAGISVARSALPPCAEGEYYWDDLVGLEVVNGAGTMLGKVSRVLATGAHDVLVLDGGEHQMIPFVQGDIVTAVDLDGRRIVVDWEASFWD